MRPPINLDKPNRCGLTLQEEKSGKPLCTHLCTHFSGERLSKINKPVTRVLRPLTAKTGVRVPLGAPISSSIYRPVHILFLSSVPAQFLSSFFCVKNIFSVETRRSHAPRAPTVDAYPFSVWASNPRSCWELQPTRLARTRRSPCPLWGQSGRGFLHFTCRLLTQSRHSQALHRDHDAARRRMPLGD